jgi:hypothetical protein
MEFILVDSMDEVLAAALEEEAVDVDSIDLSLVRAQDDSDNQRHPEETTEEVEYASS